MTARDLMTPRDALVESINPQAGVVRVDALIAWLESRRVETRAAVMFHGVPERTADAARGAHAFAGELISLLTPTPPKEAP